MNQPVPPISRRRFASTVAATVVTASAAACGTRMHASSTAPARRNELYAPRNIAEHRAHLKELALPTWGTLRYLDEGAGPAVMLVHGVPSSSWLYRHVARELIARGFRVIAPDLIGFGASDKPRDPQLLTPQKQGERLLFLAGKLGIKEWVHVCHDAGGPWTWEMMDLAPQHVGRLVVLNTIAYAEGWEPPMHMRTDGMLGRSVRRGLMSEVVGPSWTKMILQAGTHGRGIVRSPEVVEGYWRSMPEGTANAVVSFMERLDQIEAALPQYQRTLRHFEGPAMIVWGRHDSILRHREQVPMLRHALAIADRDVHILARAKHFIQEERPARVAQLIAEFARR